MKHFKLPSFRLLPAIFLCILLDSCGPPTVLTLERQKENIYYVPSSLNAPLASEKNDLGFNLLRSSGPKFTGLDLQASYLPAKHIGIIGGYSTVKNKGGSPDYMKFNRFEFGAGYFTSLSRNWHFETYAGAGKGHIDNFHYSGYSKIDLTSFFVQPAIALTEKTKRVTLGLVSRFSGVNFSVRNSDFDTSQETFSAAQIMSLKDQPFHIMWEPGLIFRAGWKNFKFQAGYSYSADLTNPDLHRSTSNLLLGVSLQFNTDEKNKNKISMLN